MAVSRAQGEKSMKKLLVTGGTVFVSRSIAEYFAHKGYEVYVLNRNSRVQSEGVKLIETDRHDIGELLRGEYFDVVVDTAYTAEDVAMLHDSLGGYGDYILISSSAVYPETLPQPFTEGMQVGPNKIWGKYGTDKIAAESALMQRNPNAYIVRPPYLYGEYNNLYREAFVFDCAIQNRKFYLPKDGEMKLQFFHIHDLCRFLDLILEKKPSQHIFNVGNREAVTVKEWVTLCYRAAGKKPEFVNVYEDIEQRNYFSFYGYEYVLDVEKQYELLQDVTALEEGLQRAFDWYIGHQDEVWKRPYMEYIEKNL